MATNAYSLLFNDYYIFVIQWWFMVIHGQTTREFDKKPPFHGTLTQRTDGFFHVKTIFWGSKPARCWHRCAVPYVRRRLAEAAAEAGIFFQGFSSPTWIVLCLSARNKMKPRYKYLVGGLEPFLFHSVGNNAPIWLIFFRGVETTNQISS